MTKPIESRVSYDSIRWTTEQYHGMVASGLLAENAPVELLYGKIVPMSPVGRYHAACVDNLTEYFLLRFGKKYSYRTQNPTTLLDDSEPEPDFVIAKRDEGSYSAGHPEARDIVVLIEVSDSTLDKDRVYKLPIYALAGVKEYWIVNLPDRQIEIYTQPKDTGEYDQRSIEHEGGQFEHDVFGLIRVDDILPGIVPVRKAD